VPVGARPGPVRSAVVTTEDKAVGAVDIAVPTTAGRPRRVVLLFPGQGSQYAGMAVGLYGREPVFTDAIDRALDAMGEQGDAIKADWLSNTPTIGIDDARRAQPMLFAIDYALGELVLSWGVRPDALLGHSAGELAAAVVAGVFDLSDAARAIAERVSDIDLFPSGGMLAVAAAEADVGPFLTDDVVIAAVNSSRQVMLAGPAEPLRDTETQLRAADFTVVTVPSNVPFHSPAMEPVAEALERCYAGLRAKPSTMSVYSGFTGDVLTEEHLSSPRFWARHITDPVYFGPTLDRLLRAGDALLIEAGPGQTLTAFARRQRAVQTKTSTVVPMLPARPTGPDADRRSVLSAAARIWTEGHDLDPEALRHW
jgi:acyl transferase domain-containing protein